jgi:hypothetical protein
MELRAEKAGVGVAAWRALGRHRRFWSRRWYHLRRTPGSSLGEFGLAGIGHDRCTYYERGCRYLYSTCASRGGVITSSHRWESCQTANSSSLDGDLGLPHPAGGRSPADYCLPRPVSASRGKSVSGLLSRRRRHIRIPPTAATRASGAQKLIPSGRKATGTLQTSCQSRWGRSPRLRDE